MKKKFLAVLLACMIAASIVPAAVSANEGDSAVVSADGSAVNQIPAAVLTPATVSDTQDVVAYGETEPVTTEDALRSAVAVEGSTVTLGANITLKSKLNVANNVTINGAGYKLLASFSSVDSIIEINAGDKMVTISNIVLENIANAKHAINVYKSTNVTLDTITVKNLNSGLGLLVNASKVTATGNWLFENNVWGDNSLTANAINVGWGQNISDMQICEFDASSAKLNGVARIYTDHGDVERAGALSKFTVDLAGDYAQATLTDANNAMGYFAYMDRAVQDAVAGATVTLNQDVTVESVINLDKQITLDGKDHSITAAENVAGNFVTISKDGTKLIDVELIAGTSSKNVLHIYKAKNVELTGVTLDHSKASAGAPMIVNESDVIVNGNLEMITGMNSWYAFNVEAKDTTANVNFATGSSVTYIDNSGNNLPLAGFDQGAGTASVTDNTGKIVAASIGEGGNTDLYDSLDKAIDAAEAIEGGATVKVLQSGLSATVDTSKNIKFDVPAGVTEPVLKDQNGNSLDITEDGSVVVVPDVETYVATINGQATAYKPGTVVSLNAPVYSADRVFVKWVVTSGNAVIANEYSNQTTFVMPEGNVTIQAVYSDIIYQPVLPEIPSYNPGGSSSKPETSKPETSEPETEWKRDDDGNTYFYKDGEKVTGWVEEDGEWYYMNEDTGAMTEESWVKVNNVWYAFDDDGHMLTGWQEIDGKWYYLKDWGGMATGWQQVDGVWYYLKGDGAMATGWVQSNGQWYYLKGNGAMATGWVESNGKWYYLYESGEMATNATIGGYYVNSNGEWVK